MHRRILGRPTVGRGQIDAYVDTAARSGFYGVVYKMLSSREYNDCFGEDTVPYERFITAGDRNARKVPGLNRPFNAAAYADLTGGKRPDVAPPQSLRTTTDVVSRNLAERPRVMMGGWSAQIAGGETMAAPTSAVPTGP
ncbi:MAG: phycobilisome rod-core linker polypeptide, partial [bacterium]